MSERESAWKPAAIILGFVLTVGCSRYMSAVTTRDVRLVMDSAEVQGLVAKQSAFEPQERVEVQLFSQRRRPLVRDLDRRREASTDTLSTRREIGEMYRHPEKYIPERIAFLDAMERAPGFAAPPKTEGEIIQ